MSPKLLRFLKWDLPYVLIILLEILILSHRYMRGGHGHESEQANAPRVAPFRVDGASSMEKLQRARVEHPVYFVLMFSLLFLVLLGGILGTPILAVGLYLRLTGRPWIAQAPHLTPEWRIWDVVKVAALVPFYIMVSSSGLRILGRLAGEHREDHLILMLSTEVCYRVLAVMLIFWIVGVEHRQPLVQLGLHAKRWLKNIGIGIVSYVAVFPVILFIMIVTILLIPYFRKPPEVPPIIWEAMSRTGGSVFLLLVLAAVMAPVSEEIFFRGLMQPAICRRIGRAAGILITATVFAMLHASLFRFAPIFVLGLLFGYVAERTQSLVPSITIHIIHNSLVMALSLSAQRLMQAWL